ncbi:hypothetical protein [Halalkalibacterium ligniniphilum]|uniref:hypothetical protein n=1 Tax=Halalkalibacterium ligniniphilum TaxID=1134413 RepID=UPI00034824A2|nr:hypothetical protein [Halalkalibacterium ligniniphilum]
MGKRNYAAQLYKIVKDSKKAISYEEAAKSLKAANPILKNTSKNTIVIKNILERFVENGKMTKTKAGSYR